jgi:hypothetical protein
MDKAEIWDNITSHFNQVIFCVPINFMWGSATKYKIRISFVITGIKSAPQLYIEATSF